MRRFNRVYLLGLFALVICLPLINDSFKFMQFERADENRKFRDSLTFDINHLDSFPKNSEAYLADNFSFRTPLIQWSKQIKFRVFRVSPNPDQLIIGRNGRYFIADDEKRIYEGDLNFTPDNLRHRKLLQLQQTNQNLQKPTNLPNTMMQSAACWMNMCVRRKKTTEEPLIFLDSTKES